MGLETAKYWYFSEQPAWFQSKTNLKLADFANSMANNLDTFLINSTVVGISEMAKAYFCLYLQIWHPLTNQIITSEIGSLIRKQMVILQKFS